MTLTRIGLFLNARSIVDTCISASQSTPAAGGATRPLIAGESWDSADGPASARLSCLCAAFLFIGSEWYTTAGPRTHASLKVDPAAVAENCADCIALNDPGDKFTLVMRGKQPRKKKNIPVATEMQP